MDKKIQKQFEKIRFELEGIADIFITGTYNSEIDTKYKDIYTPIGLDEMRDKNNQLIGSLYNGNCHMTPILIKNKKNGYQYYWFMEYDALFNGDLKEIFNKVEKDDSDLITTHIKSYEDDLEVAKIFGFSYIFGFWDSMTLGKNENENIPWFRAFLQFYRISDQAIDKLDEIILNNSWKGHFESLVPTALIYGKMNLSQFGGESKFTPTERKSLFYNSYPVDTYLGTFRFRPPILISNKKGYLFHPVKKIRPYSYFKNIVKQGLAYLRLRIFYNYKNYEWERKESALIIRKINELSIRIENALIWGKIDQFLLKLGVFKKT